MTLAQVVVDGDVAVDLLTQLSIGGALISFGKLFGARIVDWVMRYFPSVGAHGKAGARLAGNFLAIGLTVIAVIASLLQGGIFNLADAIDNPELVYLSYPLVIVAAYDRLRLTIQAAYISREGRFAWTSLVDEWYRSRHGGMSREAVRREKALALEGDRPPMFEFAATPALDIDVSDADVDGEGLAGANDGDIGSIEELSQPPALKPIAHDLPPPPPQ